MPNGFWTRLLQFDKGQRISTNEVGANDLHSQLQRLADRMDGGGWYHSVYDFFPAEQTVVFFAWGDEPAGNSRQERLFRQSYEIDGNDKISLSGSPVEVSERREFVPVEAGANSGGTPVTNAPETPPTGGKDIDMKRTEVIRCLVGNKSVPFEEADLSKMTDCQLSAMADAFKEEEETPPAPETPETPPAAPETPAPAPAQNATPSLTGEQWLAAAPPSIKRQLDRAIANEKRQKESLVKALSDSGRCPFEGSVLMARDVEELEGLVKLAGIANSNGDGGDFRFLAEVVHNAGGADEIGDPGSIWDDEK